MHTLSRWFHDLPLDLAGRSLRALKRLGCGCLLALFLLLAAGVALIAALLAAVDAAAAAEPNTPVALYLLLDESNSITDMGGRGSDPTGLRADAARLLISYLGVDAGDTATHAAAIIHFGMQPQLSAPLTPLDDAGRRFLLDRLASPGLLGWTDQLAALTLAHDDMAHVDMGQAQGRRPAVLLLTDGKAEWDETATPIGRDAYLTALRAAGAQLAGDGAPLFIILLANEATDADPDIAAVWRPLWREMAAGSPGGRFYEVRAAADLMPVYHDIVAALTGHAAAPPVVVAEDPVAARYPIPVEAGLARLTLVIARSAPGVTAQVFLPDGRRLTPALPGVRFAGGTGLGAEEVWAIETPPAGEWLAILNGAGRVTVWKDVMAQPTAAPSPTHTPSPTALPSPAAPASPAATTGPTPTTAALAVAAATPTRAALASARPAPTPAPETGRPPTVWPAIVGLGVAVAGALAVRRRRVRQPLVAGTLRPLDPTGDPERVIDLDALRRRRVLVGAPPADVVLEACRAGGQRFAIVPGCAADDGYEMALRVLGAPNVLVNGRLPPDDYALKDMDVISCGPVALRYENLRLRPAAWPAPQEDDFLI